MAIVLNHTIVPSRDPEVAFHVSEADFDAIFERIVVGGVPFGSGPHSLTDGKINRRGGGRGVYFCDPDDHVLELLTRV